MSLDLQLALAWFCFVATFSPGPNNIMLMSSGARFGLRLTVPHLFGIVTGLVSLVFIAGAGVGAVVHALPAAQIGFQIAAVVYLTWLAWKLARAGAPNAASGTERPLTWLQAAGFQWVNPKAWSITIAGVSLYATGQGAAAVAWVAATFAAVTIPSCWAWIVAGRSLSQWLTNPARQRAFNWTMAGLLLASLWPMLA